MRKKAILFFILLAILTVPIAALSADQVKKVEQQQDIPSFIGYVPDRFVVVLKSGVTEPKLTLSKNNVVKIGDEEFDNISEQFSASEMKRQFPGAEKSLLANGPELARYYKVTIESGTLDEAMEAYLSSPMVEKVEPIGIHRMNATPSDGYYSYQWHLNQTSDHDIDAPEAWDIETGSDDVIIAILDSGTRYYHPDLGGANASVSNPEDSRGNMWINTAELNGSSGVDDDGNGYTDDWIGYDFVSSTSSCWSGEDCSTADNDPRDFNGHGTHTAGIFGMITNDGYGMCGVAGGWGNGSQTEYGNGVKIMPLRMGYSYNYYGTEYGVVLMDAAAEAFYYAADNGAKIASCSWGSSNSGGIAAAATYFINAGGIICVAAGNDYGEVSADYLNGRGDCISVAATDANDDGADFTTYGTWIDICAPGDDIYSTYHDHSDPDVNYWAAMGGTSMATPMVAGVCGLIWSHNPMWTAAQVESQLYSSADDIDSYLSSKYIGKMGAGRINAYNAVNTGPSPPVADFSGAPTSGCASLMVSFTDLSSNDPTSWSWDFGDGGTSTSQNPSHTYTSAGTYTVALTATNSAGSDTETKTGYITVTTVPTADFSGSPTSGEAPLTVSFTNNSSGATSYSWDFGDGGTSTSQNPSHEYTAAGTYTVALTATNSCGSDTETKTDYITVTCTAPVANFSGSPTSGEVPLTVSFTDASTGATSWSWDFGDGGTSTSQNPSHTYTAAGTYTVALTATNYCGSDTETKTDYITVTCTAPVANFSGSPMSGEVPLTVSFTDASTGATSWSWDFGDGGTSTSQNPSHTYTAAGTYTVALTATNYCGSDTETKTDYITVTCTAPTANFSGSPMSGEVPLTVSFTDASTGATSWDWDFGDGGTSTDQNPIYTYTAIGTYTVSLTVTNSCGSDSETKTDYINVTEAGEGFCDDFDDGDISDWTILSGTWSVDAGQLDGYISSDRAFIMSPVGDVSDATITVDWTSLSGGTWTNGIVVFGYVDANNYRVADFRDGANRWYIREFIGGTQYNRASTSETINTNQQYAMEVVIDASGLVTISADGTEKVSYNFGDVQTGQVGLEVNQSHSQFDNFCVEAEVTPPPPPTAAFTGTPTSGNFPLTVTFTDQSTDSPTSWSWNFGDGGASTAQNPSHTYTAAGTYTVTLTATNAYGSDDEVKTDYITVTTPPPPTAAFSGTPISGYAPLTVSFTDESTDGPTSWSWDFGDGGTSTEQNPTYEYTSVGTYTVSLIATNAYGSDTETKTDYIEVDEQGQEQWWTITYDDFESGWGNYTDGGGDCAMYTGGTYAHQGSAAIQIRDNSGVASSFYHTGSYDVSGYSDIEVEFWFIAVSMDNTSEDFWLQYYDGSSWQTVETWARTTDFDNGVFYNKVVSIPAGTYNYPTDAKIRFMCDASGNRDYVYIDEVEFRGYGSSSPAKQLADNEPIIPEGYSLSQNRPNPFNPVTTISFEIPKASHVTLEVYNTLGQRIAKLADGQYNAGLHTVSWDAAGRASGIYFYRLQADKFVASKKMLLLK